MDVNEGSLKALEHLKEAINLSLNNGHGSMENILKIEPGPTETFEIFNGVECKTCSEIIITRSWLPDEPVTLNVNMTSVGHSLLTIMEWARTGILD